VHRIDYIISVTCSVLDLNVKTVMFHNRTARYTEARSIITHIARKEGFVYEEIGRIMGRRHHAAIMGSQKRAIRFIEVDSGFRKKLKAVNSVIGDSYQDYLVNDVHVKAISRMDLCISRITSVMEGLRNEMVELRKLKREFMKQRKRVKPGPRASEKQTT